jgi:hypothetical protein
MERWKLPCGILSFKIILLHMTFLSFLAHPSQLNLAKQSKQTARNNTFIKQNNHFLYNICELSSTYTEVPKVMG